MVILSLIGKASFFRVSSIVVLVLNLITFIALAGSASTPYWKLSSPNQSISVHINGFESCSTDPNTGSNMCVAAPFWSDAWTDNIGAADSARTFSKDMTNLLWACISVLIIGWMFVSHGLLFFRIVATRWCILVMIAGFSIVLVGMIMTISLAGHYSAQLLDDMICALPGADVDPISTNTFCVSPTTFQGSKTYNGQGYSWGPGEGFRTLILATVISVFAGCISILSMISAILILRTVSASSPSPSPSPLDENAKGKAGKGDGQKLMDGADGSDSSPHYASRKGRNHQFASPDDGLFGDPEAPSAHVSPNQNRPASGSGYGSI
eukprot:ANDGO_07639.mRNA.1 hypothetical protein